MQAVVPDAHLRSALAGIRGLGRAGLGPIAIGPSWSAAGLWSRHVSARVHDGRDDGSLLATVREISAREGRVVVYSALERTLDLLLAASESHASAFELPYGSRDALALVRDKTALATVAGDSGIAVPRTVVTASAGELANWTPPEPCAVKAAAPGAEQFGTVLVETKEELSAFVSGLPASQQLLLQERAEPPLTSVAVVVDRQGELLARFQQRAVRTWPPGAGVSVAAVSTPPDENLARRIAAMFGGLSFAGLAQVQFVWQRGTPVMIDINPRLYGSLPLALACGVNLPAIWHASVIGDRRSELGDYRTGVAFRWLEGEVLTVVRGGKSSRAVSCRALARLSPQWPRHRQVGAVWAADDPLPGVVWTAALTAGIVAKRWRRR